MLLAYLITMPFAPLARHCRTDPRGGRFDTLCIDVPGAFRAHFLGHTGRVRAD
jgi:hypothetical protein